MKATKINAYNVYRDSKKLVGLSDEVTLPDFEGLTETISGEVDTYNNSTRKPA